jgi:hypothetical protein
MLNELSVRLLWVENRRPRLESVVTDLVAAENSGGSGESLKPNFLIWSVALDISGVR